MLRHLALLLCFLSFLLVGGGAGCRTQTPVRVAVVAVGSATSSLHAAHQERYIEARAALRNRMTALSVADYARELDGINAAFALRGNAIRALSGALYSTALISDNLNRGASFEEYREPARVVLVTLRASLAVLQSPSVLGTLPLPASVETSIRLLEGVAREP